MNYNSVCEQNKILYERWEQLTIEISFLHTCGKLYTLDELKAELSIIKQAVHENLTYMEAYWKVMELKSQVRDEHVFPVVVPTQQELDVINLYKADPSLPLRDVGNRTGMPANRAGRIVTKYLQRRYQIAS